jgi:hypothetical protein
MLNRKQMLLAFFDSNVFPRCADVSGIYIVKALDSFL